MISIMSPFLRTFVSILSAGICIVSVGSASINVTQEIHEFVVALDLPYPAAANVYSQLVSHSSEISALLNGRTVNESALAALVCYTASQAIGSSLTVSPASSTEADANWSQSCWETPSCAIKPQSDQHVSSALKIINFFQVKFAVRSGGHSPNPGWSSVNQPGILIDLASLDEVSLSSDKSVLTLGPGGRWGDVYTYLDPYGVSVIGGRISDVGVGGLILGGGYYHFSGEYGLAADNVKNFHIALADGTITDASIDKNSDLFWALKGGGPNFGIVTQYELYTIPVFDIWYEILVYGLDQVDDVFDALVKWQNDGASDVKSTVATVVSLTGITVGLLYSEPADKPAAFGPFYALTPLAVAVGPVNGTVTSLTSILGSTGSTTSERHDYRAASSKIDAELYKEVYSFWAEEANAIYNSTGASQTFTIQPAPIGLVEAGNARGGNCLGLPSENMQFWTTLIDWADASDDDTVRAVSIATTEKWQELGSARGSYVPFAYMNDASRDQNPLASYGTENLSKLKAISKKYDPKQVFQTLQNGGFLLSKA